MQSVFIITSVAVLVLMGCLINPDSEEKRLNKVDCGSRLCK